MMPLCPMVPRSDEVISRAVGVHMPPGPGLPAHTGCQVALLEPTWITTGHVSLALGPKDQSQRLRALPSAP